MTTTSNQLVKVDGEPGTDEALASEPSAPPGRVVVGIGASSGGLAAFTALLAALPANTGMAYVLIQHLDPSHASHLPDLLGRSAAVPVTQATDGVVLQPDHAYVIAPNTTLTLEGDVLRVAARSDHHEPQLAIDLFLRSLAAQRGHRAIAVVLSGTGSDGTIGLAEIKGAGGITFAQVPRSANAPEMPLSAIAGGCVDFTMAPEEIGRELGRIARHAYFADAGAEAAPGGDDGAAYAAIVELLRSSTGTDFAQYRPSTIRRRLQRRMAIHGLGTLTAYLPLVRSSTAETSALLNDILITVTRFFRDEAVFDALRTTVLPALVRERAGQGSIRVWIVGCSTGQEAYSIAMELLDFIDGQATKPALQIFATDISEPSLAIARAGHYSKNIIADVPPGRLRRFFSEEPNGYRVIKSVRDLCVFARHDVTADVAFSRMDLISCRNVLIYLSTALQRRVLQSLHYTLSPGRFLLLGTSETPGRDSDQFAVVDARNHIFAKQAGVRGRPTSRDGAARAASTVPPASSSPPSLSDVQRAADRMSLGLYAPPALLVDDRLDIVQFRGQTNRFLEPSQGQASLNVLRMVARDLARDVERAIGEAKSTKARVDRPGVRLREGDTLRAIDIHVLPVRLPGSVAEFYLVLFEEAATPVASLADRTATSPAAAESDDAAQLRRDLGAANDYIQSLADETHAIQDRLSEANEDAVSANEELRCTNEEVQTAKEELESANEELATLNEELRSRNVELSQVNNDLVNLLDSIDLPVVMVGADQRLRRMTAAAARTLRLMPPDLGRPLSALNDELGSSVGIEALATEAMTRSAPTVREFRNRDGRWVRMRITPYLVEGRVEGAVIALVDIDALKSSEEGLRASGDYARAIVETVRYPLVVLDGEMRVITANQAFYDHFGGSAASTEHQHLFAIDGGRWNLPELRRLLEEVRHRDTSFADFEVTHDRLDAEPRIMLLNARRLQARDAAAVKVVLSIADTTEPIRMARALKEATRELNRSNAELEQYAAVASHDLQEPLRMISRYLMLLRHHYDQVLDDRARGFLAQAVDGAARMTGMIRSILEYARVGVGELAGEAVDLSAALRDALKNLERRVATAEAQVECGQLPTVTGSQVQFTQLFQNLIGNALKYRAPDRPPRIRITALEHDREWLVTVADNGIGIRRDGLDRVFELFERVDPSATRGSGIGLATCRKIVEKAGGRIWVDSTPDVGSVFSFTLPKGAAPAQTTPTG